MRQNYSYLKDVAYYPYIPGLRKAGLSIERIPDLQTMNDHLKKLGWGAVTVNGFIPRQPLWNSRPIAYWSSLPIFVSWGILITHRRQTYFTNRQRMRPLSPSLDTQLT